MDARHRIFEEASPMSTMAAAHDFSLPRSPRAPGVRLTRRGRLVLLALFVGLAFAVFTVLGGQSAATDDAGEPVRTRTIVVGEGDTLWGIASELSEPGQVRETMRHIEDLNALSSASLMRGQELAVPVE